MSGRSILFVCITTILLLALIEVKVLSSHDWDPRAFILERSKEVSFSQKWGIGYDGQFTYLLATNPWGSLEGIDEPAYRYQRILYPIVVRIISLNNPSLAPWMMIIINLAAVALACGALSWLLQQRDASPWLALTVIFSLGYLLSIRMDLNEPLALALALLGWVLYERDKLALAILLFALSGLTKEVGLVFPVAISLWEAFHKNWKRSFAIVLGSLAPYMIWYGILFNWFGVSQNQIDMSRLVLIPFLGFLSLKDLPSQLIVGIWVLLPALVGGICAVLDLWSSMDSRVGRDALLVLLHVGLIAVLPRASWVDPLALLRIALGLHITILVWLAGARPRVIPYAVALWAPSILVLFLVPNMM